MYKIKSGPLLDRTSFDSGARKTEFDSEGPTINENLVVLEIDVQLQHRGLVDAWLSQNIAIGLVVIGSVFRS